MSDKPEDLDDINLTNSFDDCDATLSFLSDTAFINLGRHVEEAKLYVETTLELDEDEVVKLHFALGEWLKRRGVQFKADLFQGPWQVLARKVPGCLVDGKPFGGG